MSFSGDLEHLSVVDVVQLMHAGGKSGTLTFKGRRGECRLVFHDGYIISASHRDDTVRIGRILVEAKAVGEDTLRSILREQQASGQTRKPLVALLIEKGLVRKEVAYHGLAALIQLIIVEILTWKGGTFSLDPDKVALADEFRYFPEKLDQQVQFNTEYVLMDALRIYDERKRDGLLVEEAPEEAPPAPEGAETAASISADDLGLGNVEGLQRKIPDVYRGLPDRPVESPHQGTVRELAPELTEAETSALVKFLDGLPSREEAGEAHPLQLVFYGADSLMGYCLAVAGKPAGLHVLATDEEQDLDPFIEQMLGRRGLPVLVLDAPGGQGQGIEPGRLAELRRRMAVSHPHLPVIQLVSPGGPGLDLAPEGGTVAILPRPARPEKGVPFAAGAVRFLQALPTAVKAHARRQWSWQASEIRRRLLALREAKDPPGMALALLRTVGEFFPRALTLVVRGEELVAEKGIGFKSGREREPAAAPGVRIPLKESPLLREVSGSGRVHFGASPDPSLREKLHGAIGAPLRPHMLLLPLRVQGKTISLTYGDYGQGEARTVRLEPWEILAGEAGLVLENALLNRRLA